MGLLILDTNVVSYLMRGSTQTGGLAASLAAKYEPHLRGHTLAISFMTVGELFEGAYRKGWAPARLEKLEAVLRDYLVIPWSPAICKSWARIRADRKDQPISVDDAWIAAAAVAHGCPLVTHNPSDFHGIAGLSIITEPETAPR
jgi:predicted nucleic acid-binding protein